MIAVMNKNASVKPTSGETIMGITTFSRMPAHFTVPAAASVAPTNPPIRACDEDDGRPNHQVVRFQTMPEQGRQDDHEAGFGLRQLDDPRSDGLGNAGAEKGADQIHDGCHHQSRARCQARVDTDVAMALAASWKPLV